MDSLELRELAIKRLKELEQQLLSSLQGLYSEDEVSGFFLRNQEGLIASLTSLILAKRQKQAADAPPVVISPAPVPPPATPDTGTAAPKHFFGPTPWGGYGGRALLPEEVEALKEGSRFVTAEGWHATVYEVFTLITKSLIHPFQVSEDTLIDYKLDSNPVSIHRLSKDQVAYHEVERPTAVPMDPILSGDREKKPITLEHLFKLLKQLLNSQLQIRCRCRQLQPLGDVATLEKLKHELHRLERRWLAAFITWHQWFLSYSKFRMEETRGFCPHEWQFMRLHYAALTDATKMLHQDARLYRWLMEAPTNSDRLFQQFDTVTILQEPEGSIECVVTQVFDNSMQIQDPHGVRRSVGYRFARLLPRGEPALPPQWSPTERTPVFLNDIFMQLVKHTYRNPVNEDFVYNFHYQARLLARALERYLNQDGSSPAQFSVSVIDYTLPRSGRRLAHTKRCLQITPLQQPEGLRFLLNTLTLPNWNTGRSVIVDPLLNTWAGETLGAISFSRLVHLRWFLPHIVETLLSAGAELERLGVLLANSRPRARVLNAEAR